MSLDTVNQTVGDFINPDTNALRANTIAGQEDGGNEVPETKATGHSTYEQSVINSVQGGWNKYLDALRGEVSEITQQISDLNQEVDQKIVSTINQLQTEKKTEINTLNTILGPQSAERGYLQTQTSEAKQNFDHLHTKLNRPVATNYSTFYLPLLFVLAFTELGINTNSFVGIGVEPGMPSLILAFAVGIIFIFFAHTTGKELKTTTCKEEPPSLTKVYATLIFITVLMFVVMYFLSLARQNLSDLMAGSPKTALENFSLNTGEVMTQSAKAVENLTLNSTGMMFLIFNISVYSVGAAAAFYRHDPHPFYEQIEKKHLALSGKLHSHKQKHEVSVSQVNAEFQKKIEFQNNNTAQKEKEINRLEGKLANLDEEKSNTRRQVSNGLNQMLLAYYKANQTARSTPSPKSFSAKSIKELEALFND